MRPSGRQRDRPPAGADPDASIDEDAVTEVHFTTEEFDTLGLWTPAAPGCLTAPVAGLYAVTASVRWDEDLASESFFAAIATPSGRKASEWVKANDANNDKENARTASQLTQVQRQLSSQLDDLEQRIGELAPAEDVSKLDNRLQKVENAASRTGDQVDALGKDLDDLQKRVDDLEQQAQSGTDTTGTDTTDTTP